jgi:hypothetical protein
LKLNDWPDGMNFAYGDNEIEEMAEQFGFK